MIRRLSGLLAAMLCGLWLAGCATTSDGQPPADRARSALDIARTAYTTASIAIGVYTRLTPCSEAKASRLCYDEAVGAQLVKAMATTRIALAAADDALATASGDADTRAKVIAIAQAAVAVLLEVLATYGLAT